MDILEDQQRTKSRKKNETLDGRGVESGEFPKLLPRKKTPGKVTKNLWGCHTY